jgi:hypothetical protein
LISSKILVTSRRVVEALSVECLVALLGNTPISQIALVLIHSVPCTGAHY